MSRDDRPELHIFEEADGVARAAAWEFRRRAARVVAARGRFTAVLSGGSTPERLFRLLREGPETPGQDPPPWSRVHLFWGDERPVPPDHPDSNFGAARQLLLAGLAIPAANVHRIRGEIDEPSRAAAEYEAEIRAFFDLEEGEAPRFDLVFLGIGADGHTASLFPGGAALAAGGLVAAVWVERLGTFRITLTPRVFNRAACVIFLVSGESKAEILERVVVGTEAPQLLPALAIRPESGEILWLVDRAAARLLAGQG